MFDVFGRTGAPQKRAPQTRECRTAARHFPACMASIACCDI